MDLVKIINEVIQNKAPDEARRYIGASSIGRACNREIWYSFNGVIGTSFDPDLKRTFEVGKRLETMLLDYIDMTDIVIERPNKVNKYLFVQDAEAPIFQGHMDAIIYTDTACVLEIKTAKSSSFQKFVNHGLKQWSPSYYAQMQAYMGMGGYLDAVILVMNKDNSDLHHEWISFDEIMYHELRLRALAISSIGEPPERINKNPVYFVCNRCQFKSICHGGE